jgi:DNA polymerase-3 subunit gamma/tau
MRDALSILDKIVSFTNGEVTYANTLEHLNILDADYYFRLLECMQQQDLAGAMLLYDDINSKGFEGDLVIEGFAEFLRNLLVCKDERVAGLLEVVESFKDRYIEAAKKTAITYIISAMNVLNETAINYKAARNKRLHAELALIKLTYLQQALELTATGEGISKKKLVDTAKPVAFKRLDYTAIKETAVTPAVTKPATTIEARLVIETPAEKIPAVSEGPADTAKFPPERSGPNSKLPASTGKLGALGKIRSQYSNGNNTGAASEIKPLTTEALQQAWNDFTLQLKETKNPSAQSFDLAVLRIKDESSFEIVTPNNLQLKFIESERVKLSEHLQLQFNNRQLTFYIIIEEKIDLSHKVEIPLNTKEQYQRIVAGYPLVKELKDRLRLDLDY